MGAGLLSGFLYISVCDSPLPETYYIRVIRNDRFQMGRGLKFKT